MKLALSLSGCIFSSMLFCQPGALDPSFGTGGFTTLDFGKSRGDARAIMVLPDDNILVIGKAPLSQFCFARFRPDGSPDSTFGISGTRRFPSSDTLIAMAVQADGKMLVADRNSFQVWRFLDNGASDTGFGTQGNSVLNLNAARQYCTALATQPDGKIWLAGGARFQAGANVDTWLLARLLPDGQPDTCFGTKGYVTVNFSGSFDFIRSVVIQPDGKIVAAGITTQSGGSADLAMARFLPSGVLDSAFGTGGLLRDDFLHPPGAEAPTAVFLRPDSSITVCGQVDGHPFIARYTAEGLPDTVSGTGHVSIDFSTPSFSLLGSAIQDSGGKIVMAGALGNPLEMALLRYSAAGAPDSAFGLNGLVLSGQKTGTGSDFGPQVALAASEKIAVAVPTAQGYTYSDFTVSRFLPDGNADTSFSDDGIATTPIAGGNDQMSCMAVQKDGKILLGGASEYLGARGFLVTRLDTAGQVDTGFGDHGFVFREHSGDLNSRLTDMQIQADGKILLGGYLVYGGPDLVFITFLQRLNPDGQLDSSFKSSLPASIFKNGFLYALAFQPGGKILVGGGQTGLTIPSSADFILQRLYPDGTTDSTFGQAGMVISGAPTSWDGFLDLALQPDGKIVAVGASTTANNSQAGALLRNYPDGVQDTTFAQNGIKTIPLPAGFNISGYKLLVQPDGKLLVLGQYHSLAQSQQKYLLYRLLEDGTADLDFGISGEIGSDPFPGNQISNDMALQPDGKFLLAYAARDAGAPLASDFSIRRLNADGTPDSGFGNNGTASYQLGASFNGTLFIGYVPETAVSGKIIAAGLVAETGGNSVFNSDFAVARFFSGPVITHAPESPADGACIFIQPNPATDFVDIRTNEPGCTGTRVLLYDLNGRLLHAEILNDYARLELGALPAGMYLLHLQGKSGSRVEKLIIR